MASQSPDYRQLYLEEQRRREAAEEAQEQEQRKREAAEEAKEQEQRKREAAEEAQKQEQRKREAAEEAQEQEQRKREAAEEAQEQEQRKREATEQVNQKIKEDVRKTTLPEFLDACHTHLHSGLAVQKDASLSTQGNPVNAKNKVRPEKLAFWNDFPAQQEAIWDDIMESEFPLERHFTSVNTLNESGEVFRKRIMSSELDLNMFQRSTVEEPVSLIIEEMYNHRALRRKFDLRGSVKFENHANTLSPEQNLEQGTERRRSPRLQAKMNPPSSSEPSAATRNSTSQSSRPRADQFCVYNADKDNRVAAFVIEYKAPHKIPLGYIYEGLVDMNVDDVVQCCEPESSYDSLRRLMAAIVTQAFSYMIQIGVEYGCVCTGEANIFLRVPEDPKTVYFFLSVPKGDVGDTTGWMPDRDGPNRLHLTAVGQMLAFTLQALRSSPRKQKWRNEALAKLKRWEISYSVLLDDIPSHETPSSEYRPPRDTTFFRASPVRLRRKRTRTNAPGCSSPQDQRSPSDEDSDPDTPSRQVLSLRQLSRTQPAASSSTSSRKSRQAEQGKQYCTQNCLLGLTNGGQLDLSCPNASHHGTSRHQISLTTFLKRIRQQLSKDLDDNCEPIGMHGACGVPFRVRLDSHGYTVVAKACPIDFVHRLRCEAAVYNILRPIQGAYVPVYLGNVDLKVPYYYEGIAELVHMMFLSYGGKRMDTQLSSVDKPFALQQANKSVQALRKFGILHRDLALRNMLWDGETRRVMVIDFERSEVEETGGALGVISGNTQRKRTREGYQKTLGNEERTTRGQQDAIF